MKTFIFTWDRYQKISTPAFFDDENVPYTLLVHNNDQAEQFKRYGRVNPDNIYVTGKAKGLGFNRNVALDMMEHDEWALFFVDDLMHISELDNYDTEINTDLGITMQNAKEFSKRFKKKISSIKTFLLRCEECIQKAERENINLVGFAGFTNHLFLSKKWKYNSVADGRCWLVRKTDLRFDENVQLIDDVCFTALNMMKFGAVLINQWIIPECERYTSGAYGSIEQRLPQKIQECEYLVKTYPEYIKLADKAGWPYGSHVTIINHSVEKLKAKLSIKQDSLF